MAQIKHDYKLDYDVQGYLKLLVFGRILHPVFGNSKIQFLAMKNAIPYTSRVSAAKAHDLKRFFRKEVVQKQTGEVLDSAELIAQLDMEKVEEFTAYMGYYQIVTSELTMDPLEVIDKYHGLSRIEDQFRVMKGDLQARPLFVRTREHIESHLLLCLIALVMLRLIQKQIASTMERKENDSRLWTYGLSAQRVQRALQKWKVEELPEEYYRFCDSDDPDLKMLQKAFGVEIKPRLYTRGELRGIKSSLRLFETTRGK